MKECKVRLKYGTIVTGDEFDEDDFMKLKSIFKKWLDINTDLKSLKGRGLNVPDVFSEALFCIAFDAVRTNNEPDTHSYDCVIKATGQGVQVKSTSIPNDCTSFGPTSVWDLLYFVDFAPNGYVDGNVYFYEIDSVDVYDLVVNKKKNETFSDQQSQGRRPRFSIKSRIIKEKDLKPVKIINLID
ncbi:Bsp6I family type II restriction endonuclease [Mycoplasma tullyi]|uniref:Bsp6I family type II restriction endonuclease n=1 Tax=Mycoplasma tullyi TaxID=1612150 RepID=A0A7D7YF40_9MOLU|nr:Bsp6I family type II restriction endonuclease [Mycoplasma tullyi]QMT98260.1 Bsp6I family type II restriction endonuclease [Mycoplasma tullyi]